MALNVESKKSSGGRIDIPVIENAGGQDTFNLPAGVKYIDVYRDAGIIYEGVSPDEYEATRSEGFIKKITLNTALAGSEILKIAAYGAINENFSPNPSVATLHVSQNTAYNIPSGKILEYITCRPSQNLQKFGFGTQENSFDILPSVEIQKDYSSLFSLIIDGANMNSIWINGINCPSVLKIYLR